MVKGVGLRTKGRVRVKGLVVRISGWGFRSNGLGDGKKAKWLGVESKG